MGIKVIHVDREDFKTIRFKEGDIVEIASDEFVELAIVWLAPPTREQMAM